MPYEPMLVVKNKSLPTKNTKEHERDFSLFVIFVCFVGHHGAASRYGLAIRVASGSLGTWWTSSGVR